MCLCVLCFFLGNKCMKNGEMGKLNFIVFLSILD